MVGIPWCQLREPIMDALVNVDRESCNWKVSLDYGMYNITPHNVCAISSTLHQSSMVNTAVIEHRSGNADHPYCI